MAWRACCWRVKWGDVMSIFRMVVLALLVIACGWGILGFLWGLMKRAVDPESQKSPVQGLWPLIFGVGFLLVFWYGFAFLDPPAAFMRALRAGDERKAFAQLTESLQEELGGYEPFTEWADGVRPKSWGFFSSCSTLDEGRSDGNARLISGERSSLSFSLVREDGEWRIAGVFFWDLEMDYQVGAPSYMECSD